MITCSSYGLDELLDFADKLGSKDIIEPSEHYLDFCKAVKEKDLQGIEVASHLVFHEAFSLLSRAIDDPSWKIEDCKTYVNITYQNSDEMISELKGFFSNPVERTLSALYYLLNLSTLLKNQIISRMDYGFWHSPHTALFRGMGEDLTEFMEDFYYTSRKPDHIQSDTIFARLALTFGVVVVYK